MTHVLCVCMCVCFGQYKILLHHIDPTNHSLVLGVHLNWNDWSMLYPTSPPPRRSDPVGPCTVHFYLLTNFFLRMYLMHILCVKPFAVYACSRDQLGGASDSLALRSRDGGLKFLRVPNSPHSVHILPNRSGEYNRSSVQVCLCAYF